MTFIDPAFAGQVPFERRAASDGDWAPLQYQTPDGPVDDTPAVVSIDKPSPRPGNGPRYAQGGTVFLPRGIDRKGGDRFTHNGEKYYLVGAPRGNQDHPITGDDFGWVTWTFEGGG